MAAIVTEIFNGTTADGEITTSAPFRKADFLFMVAQGIGGDEYEVAGSIVVDILGTDFIGGIPITTAYGAKEVPLDMEWLDTTQVVRIPTEITQTRLDCRLCLVTSYPVSIAAYAVSSGVTIQDLNERLEFIQNLVTALSARQLVDDAAALAQFVGAIAGLLSGDPLAITGALGALLLGTGVSVGDAINIPLNTSVYTLIGL